MTNLEKIEGVIFGAAVGDAIGLPAEGLSPNKIARRKWDTRPWKHRLIFGRGMWSDDTEHTFMVGNALLESGEDCARFEKILAHKFRGWFLALPAGVGLATARACLKLWIGFPPGKSGVFSAGNGPAMRSGILGAVFADNDSARHEFVKASTEITHTDPKALTAALAISDTVAFACCYEGKLNRAAKRNWITELRHLGDDEWITLITSICEGSDQTTAEFAKFIGCENGVSGYAFRTVPIALHAWMTCDRDYQNAIQEVINCGGDTDTCAAITGALCGAELGIKGIPSDWITNLKEWPRRKAHLRILAEKLATGARTPVRFPWILLPLRNLFFLLIVLTHGFIRLVR